MVKEKANYIDREFSLNQYYYKSYAINIFISSLCILICHIQRFIHLVNFIKIQLKFVWFTKSLAITFHIIK